MELDGRETVAETGSYHIITTIVRGVIANNGVSYVCVWVRDSGFVCNMILP